MQRWSPEIIRYLYTAADHSRYYQDLARQLEELMDALRQLAESAGSAQQEAEALRAKETLAVAAAAQGRTELAALDATDAQAQARQTAIAADSAAAPRRRRILREMGLISASMGSIQIVLSYRKTVRKSIFRKTDGKIYIPVRNFALTRPRKYCTIKPVTNL